MARARDAQDDPLGFPPSGTARVGEPATARLARGGARVRRALLARRRLLAALLVGVAVLAGLRTLAPPPAPTLSVLTAARDLPAGAVLEAGDLETRRLSEAAVPDGVVSREAAPGRTLASPVRRGETLTDARLAGPGLAAGYPGRVAVPVRIPDPAVVGLLRVGDEVEVLGVDPAGGDARTVAVARVAGLPGPTADVGGLGGDSGAPPGRLVLLAATADSARALTAAAVRDYLTLVWTDEVSRTRRDDALLADRPGENDESR